VLHVVSARGKLAADSQRKYDTALQLFHTNVDANALLERMNVTVADVVTPLMFQYTLFGEGKKEQETHCVAPKDLMIESFGQVRHCSPVTLWTSRCSVMRC